jgi:hypothetical protein
VAFGHFPAIFPVRHLVQAIGAIGPLGDPAVTPAFDVGGLLATRRDQMIDYLSTEIPNLTQTVCEADPRLVILSFWEAKARPNTANVCRYLDGSLDDTALFHRVLSAGEITCSPCKVLPLSADWHREWCRRLSGRAGGDQG